MPRTDSTSERGTTAFAVLVGMLVVLAVFLLGCNFVVFEYGQGVVRTAVDEAARAGSQQQVPGGPTAACQQKAAEVMGNLLPGPFARGITISCRQTGTEMVATASGRFPGWLPPVPDLAVHIVGAAQLEVNPSPT